MIHLNYTLFLKSILNGFNISHIFISLNTPYPFSPQKTILTFVKNRLMKKLILLAVIGLGIVSCTTQKNTKKMTELPKEWKHTTNIYEVNIRQYTQEGTFKAFAKEMPRLKAMGVKTLWFMPITPIAQQNKKEVSEVLTQQQIIPLSIRNSEHCRILKIW